MSGALRPRKGLQLVQETPKGPQRLRVREISHGCVLFSVYLADRTILDQACQLDEWVDFVTEWQPVQGTPSDG